MAWEIEFTDEFSRWWDGMTAQEQKSFARYVGLLELAGPDLCRPYADTIQGSRVSNLRELPVQHEGWPYRVLYQFHQRCTGILLIGGGKTGNSRWYGEFIPKADSLFEKHLGVIKRQ